MANGAGWKTAVQALSAVSGRLARVIRKTAAYARRHGLGPAWRRLLSQLHEVRFGYSRRYPAWVQRHDSLTVADLAALRLAVTRLADPPLISVVMPVYDTPAAYLVQAIESVLAQAYPHWELCIADDASPSPHVRDILERYRAQDARIKVAYRPVNGHITAASNTALELAAGRFVALLDHDDILPPHALYLVAEELDRHPEADILYSDEDKIDAVNRRSSPYFKGDWSPDMLYGHNAISHLGVYRRSLLEEIGGFRLGYEGSQDYDLALRAVDRTSAERIRHIPHILYHWRVFPHAATFSTRQFDKAHDAACRALTDSLHRRGVAGRVTAGSGAFYRIAYDLPEPPPLVSLLVAVQDGAADLLPRCLDGLLRHTDYPALEVIILDRRSVPSEELAQGDPRVTVLTCPGAASLPDLYNTGARSARGEVLGFLHGGIAVRHADWLTELVGQALRPEIGAVGPRLCDRHDNVRHAGFILGAGDAVAAPAFHGAPCDAVGCNGRLCLTRNVSAVSAVGMVLRSALFRELGGFDAEALAAGYADVDLCLRLRRRGSLVTWTPHAELGDHGPDETVETIGREAARRHMLAEWGPALAADPCYNPNLDLSSGDFRLAFPPRAARPWDRPVP